MCTSAWGLVFVLKEISNYTSQNFENGLPKSPLTYSIRSLLANQTFVTPFGWGNGPMGIENWTTAESTLSNCQKNRKISEEILVTHFQNAVKYNLIYILFLAKHQGCCHVFGIESAQNYLFLEIGKWL